MFRKLALALLLSAVLIGPGLSAVQAAPAMPAGSPAATATATLTPGGEGLPGVVPRGTATLKAFTNVKKLWFELRVEGLAPNSVHAWHIHLGTCENQDGIAIDPASVFRTGRGNDAPKDLKANSLGVAYVVGVLPDNLPAGSILTNGAPYYVNVHEGSSKNGFGAGQTCGNLSTNPPIPRAALAGANEVGGGDPDGSGTARIDAQLGLNRVCYALTVANLSTVMAAHIHKGPAGANGPVVVGFANLPTTGSSAGCANNVDPALIADIIHNPMQYYVNVHTNEFPGGAIRGQLHA